MDNSAVILAMALKHGCGKTDMQNDFKDQYSSSLKKKKKKTEQILPPTNSY